MKNKLKLPEENENPTLLPIIIKQFFKRAACRIIGHNWDNIDYKNYRVTCLRCRWKQYSAYPEPWSIKKFLTS